MGVRVLWMVEDLSLVGDLLLKLTMALPELNKEYFFRFLP